MRVNPAEENAGGDMYTETVQEKRREKREGNEGETTSPPRKFSPDNFGQPRPPDNYPPTRWEARKRRGGKCGDKEGRIRERRRRGWAGEGLLEAAVAAGGPEGAVGGEPAEGVEAAEVGAGAVRGDGVAMERQRKNDTKGRFQIETIVQ